MNREILFRAKRVDNGEWVRGDLLRETDNFNNIRTRIYEAKGHGTFIKHEVDPDTICQYTGFTDKDGRKIFEGDIVRDIFEPSIIGIVKYGKYRNTFNDDEFGGHVGFYIEWKAKAKLLRKDLVYWAENSEFIGNIFDNPELLEVEECVTQEVKQE